MRRLVFLILGWMLILGVISVAAQSGSGYDLTWNTIDSGGGTSSNGGYTLDGTIGQPDASNALSNAGYIRSSGFWLSDAALQRSIYLPLVLKKA